VRRNEARSVAELLEDWRKAMLATGNSEKHADQFRDRASKLIAMVAGVSFAELDSVRRTVAMAQRMRSSWRC
jgi:hypothetical protein